MDELSLKTDRRRLMQMLAAGAAGATLPLGLASPAFAADKRIAMVVKNLGNTYFDACRDGAQGGRQGSSAASRSSTPRPTKATAEDQIAVIDALIAQKVDGIMVSANDAERARAGRQEGRCSAASR